MGTLESRRKRIEENDERMTRARDEFISQRTPKPRKRSPEPTNTNWRRLALSEWRHEKVELLCECGRKPRSGPIHVDADEYERARQTADWFLCEPTDLRSYLERARLAPGKDFVIAEPLARPALEPEIDTLRLHLDALERENDRHLSDVNDALSRIAGAATTGTLVFGIYAALRPGDAEALPTAWVFGALALFVCLIVTSLFRPRAIRTWLADQLDVTRITFGDLAEWRQRRNDRHAIPTHFRPYGQGHRARRDLRNLRPARRHPRSGTLEPDRLAAVAGLADD